MTAIPAHPPKMHLIFDFDNTITAADTINALGLAGAAFQASRQSIPQVVSPLSPSDADFVSNDASPKSTPISVSLTPSTSPNFTSVWNDIVAAYGADYSSYAASFDPKADDRTKLDDEIAFQRGLRGLDLASVRRVEQAGLFTGMAPSDLYEAGHRAVNVENSDLREEQRVQLRRGWKEFIEMARMGRDRLTIVSANWSRSWIRGILGDTGEGAEIIAQEIGEGGKIVPWRPNDLNDASLVKNGDQNVAEEGLRIATSGDKLRVCQMITHPDETVIYYGDSTTDLECLLHAAQGRGMGIVVKGKNEDTTLLKTLRRLGWEVPHVGQCRGQCRLAYVDNFIDTFNFWDDLPFMKEIP